MDEDDPGQERQLNIQIDEKHLAGQYANFANISFSDYEFTITFARIDHEVSEGDVPGIVVSRVNMSTKFAKELLDALQDSWSKYATVRGIQDLPEAPPRNSGAVRIAVLSDVHANLHALEAVLAEVDAGGFDAIWCLGDLVGYGPKPNECVALLQQRAAICLAGNHDLVVLGRIPIEAFGGEAGAAARWTRPCSTSRRGHSWTAWRPRLSLTVPSSFTVARATRSGSTCSRMRRPPARSS